MTHLTILRVVALTAVVVLPSVAAAQADQIATLLPPREAAAASTLLDSARRVGLPTGPLTRRVREGVSRGAEPARIVSAVGTLLGRMSLARQALGAASSEAELVAAASALYAGVSPAVLSSMRRARPERDLAFPLIVLADLVDRGVRADTASTAFTALAAAGLSDAGYDALRQKIVADIAAGLSPDVAASARVRGMIGPNPAARPDLVRLPPGSRP